MKHSLALATALLSLTAPARASDPRAPDQPAPQASARGELRGVWLSAADEGVFGSRETIAEAMEALARHNVNAVFPAVWTRGATLWPSALCAGVTGVKIDARYEHRDPLAELVLEAHRRGIEVHPWFEFGFAAAYKSGGGVLVRKQPEWAAQDREQRLVEQDGYEWLDALEPEVQTFLSGLVLEVARGYDIDGVQLGDKLPALPSTAGYGERTIQRWRSEHGGDVPAPDDRAWIEWRSGILTSFLEKLARDVRGAGPGIVVSASPTPYPGCHDGFLQNVPDWIGRGLLDLVQPRCHAREIADVRALLDEQIELLPRRDGVSIAPSILLQSGAWRIGAGELLATVTHARARGLAGGILHHYGALRADQDELLRALSAGPYEHPTILPCRRDRWRPVAIENGFDGESSIGTWELIEGREDAFRETSGEPAELSFLLDVPVAAAYQVWLTVPQVDNLPPKITRLFQIGMHRPESAQIAVAPGMLALGVAQIPAGPGQFTLKIAVPPHEKRRMAVGPATLVLDRRRSPAVTWRESPAGS